MSYDDCLEDKKENYQNCSVLRCVQHLCTVIRTSHIILKMSAGLTWFRFRVSFLCVCLGLAFCVFWFNLDYFVLVLFALVVLGLVSSVLYQEIG